MIELEEYTPSKWPLSAEDLRYLLPMVRRTPEESEDLKVLQSLTPTSTQGVWQLTPGPYVGRLGLPSGNWIDFKSRSKFPDIVRLLQLAGRFPIRLDQEATPGESGQLLLDVLAAAFARECSRLVGRGLSKGYRTHRQLLPPHGGRIDVTLHLSRFGGRPDVLVTKPRRITVDVRVNQVLLAALEILRRIPLQPYVERDFARLRPAFSRVSAVPISASEVSRLTLVGEQVRYRDALALAEVVIRSQELLPTGAGLSGASVLFFMPKVWEGYVARWARTVHTNESVESPYPFTLTVEGLQAEADVVAKSSNSVVALYDAKYKPAADAPTRADIYQMVTYCESLGLHQATLVYVGTLRPRTVHVKHKAIHVCGLSVDLRELDATFGNDRLS